MAITSNASQVLGSSAFLRKVMEAGAEALEDMMTSVPEEIVAEVEKTVAREFAPRADVRSKEDNIPLAGSFRVAVTGNGVDTPIRFTLYSTSNMMKVMSLEKGSDPHNIYPKKTNKRGFLYFPASHYTATEPNGEKSVFKEVIGQRRPYRPYSRRAAKQASGGEPLVKSRGVWHPGTRPYKFMERAVQTVIQRNLRKAR